MGLVALAGVNAAVFHARGGLDRLDRVARAQTVVSLGLWLAVIICGRWIAYLTASTDAGAPTSTARGAGGRIRRRRRCDVDDRLPLARWPRRAGRHHGWSSFDQNRPI